MKGFALLVLSLILIGLVTYAFLSWFVPKTIAETVSQQSVNNIKL